MKKTTTKKVSASSKPLRKMTKATFQKKVRIILSRESKKMRVLFKSNAQEVAKKQLSIEEANKLWNEKYKKKYDSIAKMYDDQYHKLYYQFHKV